MECEGDVGIFRGSGVFLMNGQIFLGFLGGGGGIPEMGEINILSIVIIV
jgi:hypothetical protein